MKIYKNLLSNSWVSRGLSLLVLSLALGVHAEKKDKRGPRDANGKGGFMACFKEKFQPTEEQIKKVKELVQAQKENRKDANQEDRRMKVEEATRDFESALKGSASASEIRSQYNKVLEMREGHRVDRLDKLLAIREILTPEQRKKIGECRKGPLNFQMGGRHGKGDGHEGHHKGPRDRDGDSD